MKRREFVRSSFGLAGALLPGLALAQTRPCPVSTLSVEGGTTVSTDCPVASPGSAPAWFESMPDRTWTRVAAGGGTTSSAAGRTIQQARSAAGFGLPSGTSPSPNVTAYGGAGLDQQRKELLVHGGGHGSYAGNEVYALALADDVPSWRALNQPSPGAYSPENDGQNGSGQYVRDKGVNQAPEASHASGLVFANDRLYLISPWGFQTSAGGTSACFYFDRATNRWVAIGKVIPDGQFSGYGFTFAELCPRVLDTKRNVIWSSFKNISDNSKTSLYNVNVNTLAISRWTNGQTFGLWDAWGVYVPTIDKILLGGANVNMKGPGLYLWDPANPASNPSKLSVSNNSGKDLSDYYSGAVWHAPSNAVLFSDGNGASFAKLVANSWSNPFGAWTATAVNPAGANAVVPSNPSGLVYTRWNIVNDMGNGQSALVMLPDNAADKPTYIYKLPVSGV